MARPSFPSLDDEKATYRRWGWSWPLSLEPKLATPYATQPTRVYSVVGIDLHGDSEGDDLWTYLTMYLRTGQPGYLERAKAWARYFKDDYRQCVGEHFYSYCRDRDNFGSDHMYGWGLIAWYEYLRNQGDPTAREYLAVAELLGSDLEAKYADPDYVPGVGLSGAPRAEGRHLLLLSRLYEVTGETRWKTLLEKLVTLVLHTPEWNPTYGTYFVGRRITNNNFGAGAYESGLRVMSSWMAGILSEGLGAAYRVTGHPELRTRMVQMARFVAQYGPHTDGFYGYLFGLNVNTGERAWAETWNVTTPPKWTGAYSTAVTNILVRGYQFSGDVTLLQAAQRAFACGTHKGYQREGACPATFTTVGHFLDTQFDSSAGQGFYLANNRSELFYSHLLLINGGNPPVLP